MKSKVWCSVFGAFLVSSILVALNVSAASVIQFSTTFYNVTEGTSEVEIIVQRTNDLDMVVTVDFATTNLSATAGLDYTDVTMNLIFAAGETNQTVAVPILNDGLVEVTETFQVSLSNPTGGAVLGTRTNATVRITDNDKGLAFEFADYWAREDEGSVLIGVVRGDDGDYPITVDVSTTDVTAQAGLDYTGITNTLSFSAGEKIKLFTVAIVNDGLKEASDMFRLYLTNATGGAVLGTPRTATVTIVDNDPGVQFTQNQLWVHEKEGSVVLTVGRGNDQLLDPFTVDYTTRNGSALAGTDYLETKGTLTFAAGEVTRSLTVPILDDGVTEPDEQFRVLLSSPTGGMVLGSAANATATVTVCDTTEMLPHRFDSIRVSPESVCSLALGGGYTPGVGLSNRFVTLFDLYPLEVSTNLVDWYPVKWLVRTNASTNLVVFVDSGVSALPQRFYRTPSRTSVAAQRVPSGPYPVGVTDRTVRDTSRRNRYRISTNGSFPISIFYPARRLPGKWPTPRVLEPGVRDPRVWRGDRAPYLSSHSLRDAPLAPGLTGMPVVLWSHGLCDYRYDGTEWVEHIASHGYVVVAVDHLDSSYVAYPDGTYVFIDFADSTGRQAGVQLLADRVRDLSFVLDEIRRWNQEDDLFAGRLDVQNAAAMDWSYGGAAAGEFCRSDSRCRAAISLDGGGYGDAPALGVAGLQKPSLTMHRADYVDATLFSRASTNAYLLQIRYTDHYNFSMYYVSLTSTALDRARETARTITDYSVWFLNKYLRVSTDPMPAPTDYPQVFNFQHK